MDFETPPYKSTRSEYVSPYNSRSLQLPFRSSRRLFLRRGSLFLGGLTLSGVMAACTSESSVQNIQNTPSASAASSGTKTLRIGYQKSATVLNLLKTQGQLDQRLQGDGVTVEWSEFVAGPQMLEALNVGSIDFAYTGETPPVFAQAAGAPLVYVAYEPLGPEAEAILVQEDSPLQSVADLKGKKVALNKGSNVHYLLVRALENAGLKYTDIETVFLPPGDARPAFEQKSVDAWVIWDPFQAAAEKTAKARILTDGKNLVRNNGFFLSTQSFADSSPELLRILLEELETISAWAAENSLDVAKFLSQELGIEQEALDLAEQRRNYGVLPLNDDVIQGQQAIADVFYELDLIPAQIDIASVVWNG